MNKYIATFHSDMDCASETAKTVIEAEHENDAWEEACTYARENYTTEDRVTVTLSLHVQTALIGGQLPPPTYNLGFEQFGPEDNRSLERLLFD